MRMLGIAITVASVVLLSGCLPADPVVTPVPEASSTPVFATEDDALAAAEAAYGKYISLTSAIFNAGGSDLSQLDSVVVGKQLQIDTDGFKDAAEKGWHSIGATSYDQFSLQQFDPGSKEGIVVAYVCDDVSKVDVVDAAGKSVVSSSRPDRTMFQVTFDLIPASNDLLVSDKEPWSDESC